MGISKKEMWEKIADHRMDQLDSCFPFTQRLARDNGWSLDFAAKVIEEYKKFIYLICISDKMLTPSDEVDQAWHLHLTYTHDYWDNFCIGAVGRHIHHGPTKGGGNEDKKYKKCYASTLALYEREFGYAPPKDIWPDEKIRFGNAEYLKRIDTSKFFLLPKYRIKTAAVFSSVALLTGCTLVGIQVPKEVETLLLIVAGVGLFIWWAYRTDKKNKRKGSGCGTGCGGSGCGGGSKGNDSSDSGSDGGSGCGGGGGCGGGD